MAGNGFPSSGTRSRARDEKTRDVVRHDGLIGGFDLPDDYLPLKPKTEWEDPDVPEREKWHPATVRMWERFRRSPQAVRMVTDPDWDYLLDTMLMHHVSWMSGGKNSERFAEIRIRLAAFGATPADRARLRMDIELPSEQYPAGDGTASNVTSIDDRRDRLVNG